MRRRHHIAIGFVVCTACTILAFSGEGRAEIEMPKYEVSKRDGKVEIRHYEPYIVAYTDVEGDPESAGNEGFRRLLRYISGANRSRQSIAMTAPVTQEAGTSTRRPEASEKIAMTAPVGQEQVGNQWRITFTMPAEYTMGNLPEPLDPRVKLKSVPGHTVAAIRYSGTWKRDRYERHLSRLGKWVEACELRPVGEPLWARYDPPFKPWFSRRNEVLIPVETAAGRDEQAARKPQSDEIAGTELATFGAGCFWCVEAIFQRLRGVVSVESGYAGGTVENPSYKQVCTGTTGHAEVCRIRYDPTKVTYATLLEVFWKTHDPTTLNRQGYDVGTQYRSVIFYHTEEQRELAEKYKRELDTSGAWDKPIVTEIQPASRFYKAEPYHQNYYNSNPTQGYCTKVVLPKIEKFEKVFKDKIKPE